MSQTLNEAWSGIKAWFKHSETILLARIELISGFVITAVSAMDWSPLLSMGVDTGFTWKQGMVLGSITLAKGLITELARRRNTQQIGDRLIPTDVVIKEAVATEEKEIEVKEKKVEAVKAVK